MDTRDTLLRALEFHSIAAGPVPPEFAPVWQPWMHSVLSGRTRKSLSPPSRSATSTERCASPTGRSVRVSYVPTLQAEIGASVFMKKRRAGASPSSTHADEQWELVGLVWEALEETVLAVGEIVEGDHPDRRGRGVREL